eukprot:321259-Prymnesium_polylepis.1
MPYSWVISSKSIMTIAARLSSGSSSPHASSTAEASVAMPELSVVVQTIHQTIPAVICTHHQSR